MLIKYFFTVLCMLLWLAIFSLGAFIDTNPIRANLSQDFHISDFLLVVAAWIPTNLALLAVMASLSGALCRSLLHNLEAGIEGAPQEVEARKIIGGAIAGLLFYLALMAGAFLLMNTPFETTTKEQYFRVAGVVSFFCFLAGFRPDLLRRILEKIPGFD